MLLLAEVAQIIIQVDKHGVAAGLARHLRDIWNLLELLCYALMLASAAAFASSERAGTGAPLPTPVAAVCGCTNIVVTFNLLSLLQPYRAFGPFIQMVLQILQDIYAFLVVMLICLVGFTMAFVTMLPDQPRFQLPMALLTLFEIMLGAWDLEQFDGYQFDGDASGWGNPALTTLSVLSFVLYTVFVLVIAMNLLIAIMGDSYDRVEDQMVHGRIQRAGTLVAMK